MELPPCSLIGSTTTTTTTSTTDSNSSTTLITTSSDEIIARYIKNAKRILILVGAGISTRSGIPDFRSPSTGLYDRIRQSNHPIIQNVVEPQEIFDITLFREEPEIFYSICPLIFQHWKHAQPSLTHRFLAALGRSNNNNNNSLHPFSSSSSSISSTSSFPSPSRTTSSSRPFTNISSSSSSVSRLLRVYTQNVDGLEYEAGLTEDQVIQCHGTLKTASCLQCGHKVSIETLFPLIKQGQIPYCQKPKCSSKSPKCSSNENRTSSSSSNQRKRLSSALSQAKGVMKPDIVFFHESLPIIYEQNIETDIQNCDLLLVIGTSLAVKPVSLIPSLVSAAVPKILINKESTRIHTPTNPNKVSSSILSSHSSPPESSSGGVFTLEVFGDCDTILYNVWKKCAEILPPPYTDPLPHIEGINSNFKVLSSSDRDVGRTISGGDPDGRTMSSSIDSSSNTSAVYSITDEWNIDYLSVSNAPMVRTTRSGRTIKVRKG